MRAMSASAAAMLAGIPLFSLLDDTERALLAERIDVVTLKAGQMVFERGDPGEALYVIRSGRVDIYITNDTGHRLYLERPGPGEFFGETSLLDAGPRTASACVLEDVEALVVDRGDLFELFHLRPAAALDMLTATGKRLRANAQLLRHSASRDVNQVEEDNRTRVMKVADWISEFSGSLTFLFIHVVLFAVWILLNVRPLSATSIGNFDPFPFGLLTMCVSLEAIILSVFVLLSQNRQAARDHVRNDIEYDVNLKAELEVAQLHERLEHFREESLRRFSTLESLLQKSSPGAPALPPPEAARSSASLPPDAAPLRRVTDVSAP
jgi:uncharacterized membrane protein